ncbi:MAG: hypothetical protein JWL73_3276 [Actinomycetia bacterium]|nr:hypothetical protein [Actinomycetes bacterium]
MLVVEDAGNPGGSAHVSGSMTRQMLKQAGRIAGVTTLALVPVLAVQVGLGSLLAARPELAWGVALAFVGLVLVLTVPSLFLVAALPAMYLSMRVGPASTDISLADVALAVAAVVAIPSVPWRSPRLQSILKLLAVYLLVLAIAVVAVPSQRAVIEWGHRAFLVAGGLFVGAAVVATGRVRDALRAYLLASTVVAVAAIVFAGTHPGSGLFPQPAYPFGFQKNTAGLMLGFAIIVLTVGARRVAVPRSLRVPCVFLLVLGILACQARGPAIALMVVLSVWAIHKWRARITPLILVGGLLLLALTYTTINSAFQSDSADSRYNSVNSRVATYDAAISLWQRDPVVGVGLKFWRNPSLAGQTGFGEPHDLAVSALGESGLVGLAGLAILLIGTIVLVMRRPSQLSWLAVLVVVAKTTASAVDIYWVAGSLTFMWIIVGFACAADPPEPSEAAGLELSAAQ